MSMARHDTELMEPPVKPAPLWSRLLRCYALHWPIHRGKYRLAVWAYGHLPIPDISVEAAMDRTISIRLHLKTWVDFNMYHVGLYEHYLARFFLGQIRPDTVFLDVGAYIGQYTLLAAKYAPLGQVFAFEPHAASARRLQEAVERNGFARVRVFTQAVGKIDGETDFYWTPDASTSSLQKRSSECHRVPVTTLDAFCEAQRLDHADLIKIDVEGAEHHVLEGARAVLEHYRPMVIVEIQPPARAYDMLQEAGYRLFRLHHGRLLPLEEARLAREENVIGWPREQSNRIRDALRG